MMIKYPFYWKITITIDESYNKKIVKIEESIGWMRKQLLAKFYRNNILVEPCFRAEHRRIYSLKFNFDKFDNDDLHLKSYSISKR